MRRLSLQRRACTNGEQKRLPACFYAGARKRNRKCKKEILQKEVSSKEHKCSLFDGSAETCAHLEFGMI